MKDKFNIVFAINNDYVNPLYITLVSILENNKNDIDFYIISKNIRHQ